MTEAEKAKGRHLFIQHEIEEGKKQAEKRELNKVASV